MIERKNMKERKTDKPFIEKVMAIGKYSLTYLWKVGLIIIGLLIVASICWPLVKGPVKDLFISFGVSIIKNTDVQTEIRLIVKQELEPVVDDIGNIKGWILIGYASDIEKQWIKINERQNDIYIVDLERALSCWELFPDDMRTPVMCDKIDDIKNYYLNTNRRG